VRRRPNTACALVLAVLSVTFVAPSLLPGKTLSSTDALWFYAPWITSKPASLQRPANPEQIDMADEYQPWLRHTRASLPTLPLWNAESMAGRPFVGAGQTAVFSPFSVPAYVLPFWFSLGLIAALKLFVASFGTFLLGRALGMRLPGALLSGIVFAFGLGLVAWLPWPIASAWALCPWLLLAIDRAIRRPDLLGAAAVAASGGLVLLTGHPESAFHVLVVGVLFGALRMWTVRDRPRGAAPVLLRCGVVGVGLLGAVGLAAVFVVPFLELLAHSDEGSARAAVNQSGVTSALPARTVVGVLTPDWWGRPTRVALPSPGVWVNRGMYVGALPLALAVVALVARTSRLRIGIAVGAALALLIALGVFPFADVSHDVPGFDAANNTRLTVLFTLCVALLAGWGLSDLLATPLPARARWALVPAVLLVVLALGLAVGAGGLFGRLGAALDFAWAWGSPGELLFPGPAREVVRLGAALVLLPFAVGALAVLWLRVGRGRVVAASTFAGLAIALVVLDLFRAGVGTSPAISQRIAQQPATPGMVLARRDPGRVAAVGLGLIVSATLPSETGLNYGLRDARGFDFPAEKHYDRLWSRAVQPGRSVLSAHFIDELRPAGLRALRLLGVTRILFSPGAKPPPLDGLRVVYTGRDGTLVAVDDALPQAFVVGKQEVVPTEQAALHRVLDPRVDLRTTAIVTRAVPGLATGGPPGQAALARPSPERIVVNARTAEASLLVVDEVHYPGWSATVDGREAPIVRVDYLLRGVPLGPGRHRIVLTYDPPSFTIGATVSLVALLTLLVAVAVGLRRRAPRAAGS
jgi:Bacterial membrane protein YfhO